MNDLKKKIEEEAEKYSDRQMGGRNKGKRDLWWLGNNIAFKEGAKFFQSLLSQQEKDRAVEWVSVEDRLPEKPNIREYEHVPCLVFHNKQIKLLMWNCEHLCWDGEDGDDFYCYAKAPTHWQYLPQPPQR